MRGQPKRSQTERGAAAVEFALVAPLLVTLVFGIVDFGYFFGQYTEVRHASREGARVAAVSNDDFDQDRDGDFDADDIVAYTCDRLNLSDRKATVAITQDGTGIGDDATITVELATGSLSGVLELVVPDKVSSSATFRLEALPTWTAPAGPTACPSG